MLYQIIRMENSYSSVLVTNAVNELSRLPGIGKKTALRLALHLLRQPVEVSQALGSSVIALRENIKFCRVCHNISDTDICSVCSNPKRDKGLICVVENFRDMIAIENTTQFNGVYHILGGIISPMEGVGPSDLNISTLFSKVQSGEIREVIMALPSTVEGDTTIFYLYKTLKNQDIIVSIIARGIPIGDELDYTDEVTLGRSIINRQPYKGIAG